MKTTKMLLYTIIETAIICKQFTPAKTILFYFYFMAILMLSHLFFSYFILKNLHLSPQGFDPEAKTRGGIKVSPAYTYKECVKYWCSMRINPDLMKLRAQGGPG